MVRAVAVSEGALAGEAPSLVQAATPAAPSGFAPCTFAYQGLLTLPNGDLPSDKFDMKFAIFDAPLAALRSTVS